MFSRRSLIGWSVFFACCALTVHLVKFDAQGLRQQNAALQYSIQEERLALHMLQAEWVYLSRPDRLAALAEKYLPLLPLKAKEVVAWQALPQRPVQQASLQEGH